MALDYSFSKYTKDKDGNQLYLIHSPRSYYSMIIVKKDNNFYDGLYAKLTQEMEDWCKTNLL